MLRVPLWRVIPDVVGSLTPWHLEHISCSKLACATEEPLSVRPDTPCSGPGPASDALVALPAACALWQSVHATCRGIVFGFSPGACTHWFTSIGWCSGLRNSVSMFFDATLPPWQTVQFAGSADCASSRCGCAAPCERWQLRQAFCATVEKAPGGHGSVPMPLHVA